MYTVVLHNNIRIKFICKINCSDVVLIMCSAILQHAWACSELMSLLHSLIHSLTIAFKDNFFVMCQVNYVKKCTVENDQKHGD